MSDRFLQLGVFLGSIIGYVVLALYGEAKTAEYVTLIGPVLAVVVLKGHLGEQDETLKAQNQVLNKIDRNTNGVLTERIKEAVGEALDEHGEV